jgi:hypothetical protein
MLGEVLAEPSKSVRKNEKDKGRRRCTMNEPAIVIAGISIPRNLVAVVHGRKYRETNGHWVLATRGGTIIATFSTEAELDSWWKTFQLGQGRQPEELTRGKPRVQKPRVLRDAERPRPWDPLKPWSEKYDMPEYDLE